MSRCRCQAERVLCSWLRLLLLHHAVASNKAGVIVIGFEACLHVVFAGVYTCGFKCLLGCSFNVSTVGGSVVLTDQFPKGMNSRLCS